MATKSWTAHDLRMGKLEIIKGKNKDGQDVLTITRQYRFIDDSGSNVGNLACQRLIREILMDDMPTDIKAAFVKVHQWTRNEALQEQGMK